MTIFTGLLKKIVTVIFSSEFF